MMRRQSLLATVHLLSCVMAQKVGTLVPEPIVGLTWTKHTSTTSYQTQAGRLVLDAEWRSTHLHPSGPICFGQGVWNYAYCPETNPPLCAQRCALEGADYYTTYGISTSGFELQLRYVTQWSTYNVGSRVFVLSGQDNTKYEIWKPLNKEFTFSIDASNLPCGVKATVSFIEMDADGGKTKYPSNLAGAKYGTGYCDSKCPRIKWINGEANVKDWTRTDSADLNGFGRYGSCCGEVDLFEGNALAASFSAHPCSLTGPTRCENDNCGGEYANPAAFFCDSDGCDWNSYRLGNATYYGKQQILDTNKKLTIVTRFITDDGTDNGNLVEIKRYYIQDGKVYPNAISVIPGLSPTPEYNSIENNYCDNQKAVFGEMNHFQAQGGLQGVGESLKRGVVLSFSILDDWERHLQWLDGKWPVDWDPAAPGVARGPCDASSGDPEYTRLNTPNSGVRISNIKFGPIGTTTNGQIPA